MHVGKYTHETHVSPTQGLGFSALGFRGLGF